MRHRGLVLVPVVAALSACNPKLTGPAPSIESVDPPLVCAADAVETVTVKGSGFAPVETLSATDAPVLATPTIRLVPSGALTGGPVDAEPASPVATWIDSGTETFALTPALAVPDGVYDVVLTNPDGQSATSAGSLAVAGAPVVDGVTPALFCNEQEASELRVTGSGFLQVEGAWPTVTIGTWTGTASGGEDCSPLVGPVTGERCSTLVVTVPAGSIPAGIVDVSVTNPAPADCTSAGGVQVQVVSEPVIDALEPEAVCNGGDDVELAVLGSGFVTLDGSFPTVFVDGDPYVPTASDCEDLGGPAGGQACSRLDITLPSGTYGLGAHDVTVTNPAPADCSTSEAATLTVNDPPTLADVEPDTLCEAGGTITLVGTGFVDGLDVSIGGVHADEVEVLDANTARATFPGDLPVGFADVTVSYAGGCEDTLPVAIEITAAPLVFYVDPPVVYNGISVSATVYVAGVTGTVTSVSLVSDTDGSVVPLSFAVESSSRILADIPAGLAAGEWDVEVVQDGNCGGVLESAVHLESYLSVAIEEVDPPFAWTGGSTAVAVTATDPVPFGEVQFQDVPRIYLNPTGGGTTATALSSVAYVDPTLLNAIVPAGLAVGTYDVIAVNPDGTVGLLTAGLEVTAEVPPTIDTVAPPSVASSADEDVTIRGANFRDATVDLDCRDATTGTVTTVAATVGSQTSDTIVATVPSTSFSNGAVCLVRVTDSDGTYAEWSAISVTNPASNLFGWEAGEPLVTARRAPAAVAGRATNASRFLYAIGGDDGTTAGAFDSIELAPVDAYGELGAWDTLVGTLPSPRTLAGVGAVGRFVYLVGGSDGTAALSSVLRAEILDPEGAPDFDDLAIDYGDGTAMTGGTWIYRVSALFDSSDAANPGGESLPSDPIVVRLPDVPDTIELTLIWTSVPGASGYRVYRTPTADSGSGTEEWLTDVAGGSTLSYTDLMGATTPGVVPLPTGALGNWRTIASLGATRESPCVTVAVDPTDSDVHYLYAAGGRDGSTLRDTIEYLDITEVSDTEQTVGSWKTSANLLPSKVYQCGAWSADATLNDVVPEGETWVYFGGGRTASSTTGEVMTGAVGSGGELSSWASVDGMSPSRAGFGVAGASNFLYAFGGQKASPSASGTSTEIQGPPDLDNWNSLGISMSEPRYLMGSAQESAVIFMVGGQTDTASATSSVDFTNF